MSKNCILGNYLKIFELRFVFQALCSAVEQEKLEKVRSILENQTHVNVNGVNGDGFTLLDLAFMTGII